MLFLALLRQASNSLLSGSGIFFAKWWVIVLFKIVSPSIVTDMAFLASNTLLVE